MKQSKHTTQQKLWKHRSHTCGQCETLFFGNCRYEYAIGHTANALHNDQNRNPKHGANVWYFKDVKCNKQNRECL